MIDDFTLSTSRAAEIIGLAYGNGDPFFVRVPPKLGCTPQFETMAHGGLRKLWTPRQVLSLLVYREVEHGHEVDVAITAGRAVLASPQPFIVAQHGLSVTFATIEQAVNYGKYIGASAGPWAIIKIPTLSTHPDLSDILDYLTRTNSSCTSSSSVLSSPPNREP